MTTKEQTVQQLCEELKSVPKIDIAERAKISMDTVYKLCRGDTGPKTETVERVRRALKAHMEEHPQ